MTRARILHLHSSFDLGGKEARTAQLMNHFGDRAEHTILVGDQDAMGARDAIDRSVDVSFPGDAAPSLLGKPGMWRYQKLADYMADFDLILSYNWGAMDGVMAHTLLGRFKKLPPLIHHEDGFNEDEFETLNQKRNWFRRLALARSYALVVPSRTLAQIARSVWNQPSAKICHFPNGIKVDDYQKKPQRGSFPDFKKRDDEVVVGTVAGLRKVKNLPRLVRAVAAAGDNIRLAIAGEGPARAEIEAEAARLGISDRMMMPGFVKNPARYIGLFDIFALSSDSEQFPISLVEAMAAKCPIVATDVGDVRNMVTRNNLPYIVPRDDEAALAGAIADLAELPSLRSDIGYDNHLHAWENYQQGVMFDRYTKLYGSAMGRAEFSGQ